MLYEISESAITVSLRQTHKASHCQIHCALQLCIHIVFFVGNKLAPLLIERKSVDDVASSLADGKSLCQFINFYSFRILLTQTKGRWERQQHNMRKAQYVLGGGESRKCKISYLIEGDASKRQVHGGFIGRATWRKVSVKSKYPLIFFLHTMLRSQIIDN